MTQGRAAIAGGGLPDLLSAWAEPGRAGWIPDAWNASGLPWTLAGLGPGAVRIEEANAAPGATPAPGVAGARRALGSSDSVQVAWADDGAWLGFGAPLARVEGTTRASPEHAAAIIQLLTGANGYESNGLGVARGDARSGINADILSGSHGAQGWTEREGRHLWGGSARGTRGAHSWSATYAQRGTGVRLAEDPVNFVGGEEENAAGESGTFDYRYRKSSWWAGAALARGYDHHESSGDTLRYSRRDAAENRAALEAGFSALKSDVTVRLEVRRATAARVTLGATEFDRTATQWWGAVKAERVLRGGRLEATLGGGRDGGTERNAWAPTLAWAGAGGALDARVSVGRLLEPVWTDLAPGTAPFLQSTWAAGAHLGARAAHGQARLQLAAGQTSDRALVSRLPLAELWLRAGLRRDPLRYRFALAELAGEGTLGALVGSGEGFLLGRDRDDGEPQVDPSWGARAAAGCRFHAFKGDLGVELRGEAEWTGARQTQEPVPHALPTYTSLGAAAVLTLADATLTLRARNLEDRPQPQVWISTATGRPAQGPGTEFRVSFTWRLFN
ncbi:MAG TPA: hypothetical protein VI792_07870 [Candidatus Eisenbacteria bacterium]